MEASSSARGHESNGKAQIVIATLERAPRRDLYILQVLKPRKSDKAKAEVRGRHGYFVLQTGTLGV